MRRWELSLPADKAGCAFAELKIKNEKLRMKNRRTVLDRSITFLLLNKGMGYK
jgi:hypothetical protein